MNRIIMNNMNKMKIVVLDGYTLNLAEAFQKELAVLGECTYYERTPADKVLERAQEAEVVFTNKVVLSGEIIALLPKLKYIGVLATGYNVVDIEAAKARGIVVTNIPAYSTSSVAQMVFAHILNITQRVGHYAEDNSKGRWTESVDFCYWDTNLVELDGKKMGIVGFGNIGKATARIAQAFGMEVWVYTSKEQHELPEGMKKVSLDDLFAACDVVSLHCPLTPETKGMVNAERLKLMKSQAILINTGRGPLINEQDLADALNEGRIGAAGLDVLSVEPSVKENPLLGAKNCFITPHIAWATKEARTRLMDIAVGNLKAYIEGHIINNVAK
jgi:glycerate dehydrogenase